MPGRHPRKLMNSRKWPKPSPEIALQGQRGKRRGEGRTALGGDQGKQSEGGMAVVQSEVQASPVIRVLGD